MARGTVSASHNEILLRERYKLTFDVSRLDEIFDTLLRHKQFTLTNDHVILSLEKIGGGDIVNGKIYFLTLL